VLAEIALKVGRGSSEAFHLSGESLKRALVGGAVLSLVINVVQPQIQSLIEIGKGFSLESSEKLRSDGAEESLDFSPRRTVIGFGVDERDPGLGAASRQQIRGETRTVIAIKTLTKAVGQEGLLENDG